MQLWNSQNIPKNASELVSYLPEIRFRPGGFAPLVPLPGLCPGPTGGLGGPHTPCLLCFHIVQGLATPLKPVIYAEVQIYFVITNIKNIFYISFVTSILFHLFSAIGKYYSKLLKILPSNKIHHNIQNF